MWVRIRYKIYYLHKYLKDDNNYFIFIDIRYLRNLYKTRYFVFTFRKCLGKKADLNFSKNEVDSGH